MLDECFALLASVELSFQGACLLFLCSPFRP
jgi:hypothetical protein